MTKPAISIFLILFITDYVELVLSHKDHGNKRRHSTVLHKKTFEKHERVPFNNLSKRCNIVCPIEVFFSQPGSVPSFQVVPENFTSPIRPITEGVFQTFSTTTSPKSPTGLIPHITNNLNQILGTVIPNILGSNPKKSKSHHHLTKHQKERLLKKLILANYHGSKGYKFRQFQPSGCYVECSDVQQLGSAGVVTGSTNTNTTSNTQQGPHNEDDENSEDDSSDEVDDTPIEVTIEPPE